MKMILNKTCKALRPMWKEIKWNTLKSEPLFQMPRQEETLKECSALGRGPGFLSSKERSAVSSASSGMEELLVFRTSSCWLGNSGFIKRKREEELQCELI